MKILAFPVLAVLATGPSSCNTPPAFKAQCTPKELFLADGPVVGLSMDCGEVYIQGKLPYVTDPTAVVTLMQWKEPVTCITTNVNSAVVTCAIPKLKPQ